jgi:hypothetical protein
MRRWVIPAAQEIAWVGLFFAAGVLLVAGALHLR